MQCVVLDTNILVSALWTPRKLEGQVVELALARRFPVAASEEVFAEYVDVLGREKFAKLAEPAGVLLRDLRTVAQLVTPIHRVAASRDEDDNRLLECADAAHAAFLVTGNLGHFPAQWNGSRVVNARTFLEALGIKPRIEWVNAYPSCLWPGSGCDS
jgi:uncharacterized protein